MKSSWSTHTHPFRLSGGSAVTFRVMTGLQSNLVTGVIQNTSSDTVFTKCHSWTFHLFYFFPCHCCIFFRGGKNESAIFPRSSGWFYDQVTDDRRCSGRLADWVTNCVVNCPAELTECRLKGMASTQQHYNCMIIGERLKWTSSLSNTYALIKSSLTNDERFIYSFIYYYCYF